MPGPRRAVLAPALVLAAVGAAVSGCAGTAAPEPARPQKALTQARLTDLHQKPPVTRLLFTPDTEGAEAQRKSAITCMAKHGYRYAPVAVQKSDDADQLPQPFGLEAPVSRRAGAAASPPVTEKPPAKGSPESTAAYAKALFGDESKRVTAKGVRMTVSRPGNGCLAEAETRLLGNGRMRWLQLRILLFEAQEQARKDVEKDAAFQTVTGRWRQCMKQAGFKAKDPVGLLGSLNTDEARHSSPALPADLRCKTETGYLTTAYTRLAAVQQRWLDRHPDVQSDWTSLSARQKKAAGEVLGTGKRD
ncbi:hypothetical protein [Streptomyces olivochromogenes]|uniref:hypothetical protein n=1 Tax=Streptomyces olivochromogenes TaxID=1963 RepID=UPI001F34DDAD|nr:hypothetical protein [Streptomyces olivochromogenes]MCF3133667.1 hypothetical protein [Streptomyces olivochromogenes]